jgi:regulator of sigma E protease
MDKMFAPIWDWQSFWKITALFSLILALMNILPIPALDGGHALFTLIEMITGRKPGDKFMEYAQMAGMVLLLGLMAYALGLDIFRLFK